MTAPLAPPLDEAHETFRDELASVHKDGRRKWVYARQPSGRLLPRADAGQPGRCWRSSFAAPFVSVPRPAARAARTSSSGGSSLFGIVFWPQDFHLVVLVALTASSRSRCRPPAVGRIWCGWLCPQTVFMEMVFRRIEYLIDGSAAAAGAARRGAVDGRRRLGARALKHALFFALSFADRQRVPRLHHRRRTRCGRSSPTRPRSTSPGLVAITVFSLALLWRLRALPRAGLHARLPVRPRDVVADRSPHDHRDLRRRRGEPRGRLSRDAHRRRDRAATASTAGSA